MLVGAGTVSTSLISNAVARGWPIVCADGGVNYLQEVDAIPSVVIGDMDSLARVEHWQQTTTLVQLSEQDTTDFEKCLYTVSAPLYLADGFSGSRFDHTLASLHTLQKYVATHRVVMTAGTDICFACDGDLHIALAAGIRCSIYPLCRTLFRASTGLKYPLDGLTLEQGGMIGTSNTTTGRAVELQIEYGVYLVILPVDTLQNVLTALLPVD